MSYLTLPKGSTFDRVLGRDPTRPVLRHAQLRKTGDTYELVGTDSYKLAVVTLTEQTDDTPEPVTGLLSSLAVQMIVKHGSFRAGESHVELLDRKTGRSTGLSVAREDTNGMKFPDAAAVMAKAEKGEKPVVIGLNAKFLADLAAAYGEDAVRLTIHGPLRAFGVTPLGGQGGEALLMPIRVDV